MDYSGTLIGFAQLSLVLTGFVAVFIAVFSAKGAPSRPDVHHALSMLIGSVLALLISLVPLVIAGYGLTGNDLWFWSSAFGVGLGVIYGASMLNLTLRLTKEEFKQAGVFHMLSSYTLGFGGSALMLWNLLAVPSPGHYMLAMIMIFMVALIGFISFSIQNFLKL